MKSIQEHLRQLLQTVPTFEMLRQSLCIDTLLKLFSKAQINQVEDVSQKLTLHRPNSLT